METQEIELPSTGLHASPPLAISAPTLFTYGIAPYPWESILADDGVPTANQFGVPDKEQGASLSCTSQCAGYGFFGATEIDISREDPYSHTALANGGAYLTAPYDWLNEQGYLLLSQYPDPSSENETNMRTVITIKDGEDRIRSFSVTRTPIAPVSLDAAAAALQNHTFLALGICGSWSKGWNGSWTDPKYQGQNDWQHALYVPPAGVVIRKGEHALKAKSSWTQHKDYLGQQSFCHYINQDYFNNGGVFEILAVDIKELTPMNETVYSVNFNGKAGLLFQGGYGANIIYANNPGHYAELGDAFGKATCKATSANPDPNNSADYTFSPFDITINVPTSGVAPATV